MNAGNPTTSSLCCEKICAYCGRGNSDTAVFCFECGTHLDQTPQSNETVDRVVKRVAKAAFAILGAMASGCLVWASLRDIIIGSHGGVSFREFIVFSLPLFLYAVGYFLFAVLPNSILNRIYPNRARRWLLNYYALWILFILLLCVGVLIWSIS